MTTQTRKSIFNRPEKAYVHPYFGGVVLGIVLFLAFLLTGNGLGSSGATSRLDAALVDAVAPSLDRACVLWRSAWRFYIGRIQRSS